MDLIENILLLREAERRAGEVSGDEIRQAREYLEELLGPTLRPADAARSLSISAPSLKRWLDAGEISTVVTPQGRREIPSNELIQLLDEVRSKREAGSARPVAEAIKERKMHSAEVVDIARLLPKARPRGHRTAELQALAYHRLIAERLTPAMVAAAQRRLRQWEQDGRIDPRWAREWQHLLKQPISRIAKTIGAQSKRSAELRQTSPFAGLLTPQERRRLTRAVEERAK